MIDDFLDVAVCGVFALYDLNLSLTRYVWYVMRRPSEFIVEPTARIRSGLWCLGFCFRCSI